MRSAVRAGLWRRPGSGCDRAAAVRWAHGAAAETDKIEHYDRALSGVSTLNREARDDLMNRGYELPEVSATQTDQMSQKHQQQLADLHRGYEQLREIKHVGEQNAELLLAAGCTDRKTLAEKLISAAVLDDDDRAVRYLKSAVGIKRGDYAMSIIREARRERQTWEAPPPGRVTMCVEGNISVGKTTFLEKVCHTSEELSGKVQVVPEPIAQWTDMPYGHRNLLEAFYQEPDKYGYMFQNYVFCTRVEQEQGHDRPTEGSPRGLRLLERSVFSDLRVFVRAGFQQGYLDEMQRDVYLSCVAPIIKSVPSLQPDAFVYLRAAPETCHERLQSRCRAEETGVPLDYLNLLHQYHEEWMTGEPEPQTSDTVGLNIFKFAGDGSPFSPNDCKEHDDTKRPNQLAGVPTLVLDCEPNILIDEDAKRDYSRKIRQFWEYVQAEQELKQKMGAMGAMGDVPMWEGEQMRA